MADTYYAVPENPTYDLTQIRRIQNSDPVNADQIVNPVIEKLIENIAAVKSRSTRIVVSKTPPTFGPVLWFCDGKYEPVPETLIATADLGDPVDAENADMVGEVNDVLYPVINATVAEEGGNVVATIEQK